MADPTLSTEPNPLLYLYGGDRPWNLDDWAASDDRVRGGASCSVLLGSQNSEVVRFLAVLDTTPLGGAAFASRRTQGQLSLDLSRYEGLGLEVASGDDKRYTLVLKDEVPPTRPDGREQSSVSWEIDFTCRSEKFSYLILSWPEFKPTYRGRPLPDAKPLDLSNIQRIAIMVRSHFNQQHGEFELNIRSIAATPKLAIDHSSTGTGSIAINDDTGEN